MVQLAIISPREGTVVQVVDEHRVANSVDSVEGEVGKSGLLFQKTEKVLKCTNGMVASPHLRTYLSLLSHKCKFQYSAHLVVLFQLCILGISSCLLHQFPVPWAVGVVASQQLNGRTHQHKKQMMTVL